MAKTLEAIKPKNDFLPGADFNPARLLLVWAGALAAAFFVYQRSMNGEFVFDDLNLPFKYVNAATMPWRAWIGARPVLMATYWANYLVSGLNTFSYHLVNVVLHATCSVMILLTVNRVLEMAGVVREKRRWLCLLSAAIFLLHPVQTESVSYIASRSEDLSVLLFLVAYWVFLYRKDGPISWGRTALILLLYGTAMTCKEHTAVLPAVLLVTDYFFNPGYSFAGVRRNWRLYAPMLVGAVAGVAWVFARTAGDFSVGFHVKAFTWYQYLFTQFRAFFVYFRLLLFPYRQMVDYNFPASHNLLEHGAFLYGAALLALVVAAFRYRKKYPLCAYGFFIALVMFAPTSSIVPINDPVAERRLYLPFLGLLFVLCGALLNWRWFWQRKVAVLVAVSVVLAILTNERNAVWQNPVTLWSDVVAKDPKSQRAQLGLGTAYALAGNYGEAIPHFQESAAMSHDYASFYNLGTAYEQSNQLLNSAAAYRLAAALSPNKAEVWAHIGIVDAKMGLMQDAFDAFDRAQKVNPEYALTYKVRGTVYLSMSQFDEAMKDFEHALAIDPQDSVAKMGIYRAYHRMRQL